MFYLFPLPVPFTCSLYLFPLPVPFTCSLYLGDGSIRNPPCVEELCDAVITTRGIVDRPEYWRVGQIPEFLVGLYEVVEICLGAQTRVHRRWQLFVPCCRYTQTEQQ
jgi:hypothetical protein